jgi:hypothetical protein
MPPGTTMNKPEMTMGKEKTLRDEFAMAALQGLIAANSEGLKPAKYWASMCFNIADAMLKARSQNGDSHHG